MTERNGADRQLNELRERVREIRTAKRFVQEYRINASLQESRVLSALYTWLEVQEQRTIAMGERIKSER